MKVIIKDAFREIKKTYKRFISIILMALLGVAVFVGIGASGDNIANTVGTYFKDYDIYDLKLISTLGLTNEDLEEIQKIDGVTTAIATYEKDVLLEINGSNYVINAMEYNETLNKVELVEGNIPSSVNEVMIDSKLAEEQNIKIGDKINLQEVLEENEEAVLKNTELTVSGISNTPLFMTDERGTSKLGTGKVDYYVYMNKENINSDIYTTIYIATNKVDGLLVDSEEYKTEIEALKNSIDSISEQRKQARYDSLVNEAMAEINDAQVKLDEEKQNAEKETNEIIKTAMLEQIAEAQAELDEAKQKIIDEIEYPKWYLWDRKEANTGYSATMQYSEILTTVSKVFPLLFFAIATLMSLNSMTRMVDEERTQIGTLKAMGYSKAQISSKYILYALLATVIGNILGVFVGFELLTNIIVRLCLDFYTVPYIPVVYDFGLTFIGCLVSALCIVGGAIYASYRKLRHVPAKLMRPKAPKIGKRVFLEKIPFIWNKLSFTQKVTFRNMFRYKKRFLMTIVGISGATALTLVGFGVNDSTSNLVPLQYNEIYNYQMTVALEDMPQEEQNQMIAELQEKEEITSVLSVKMQSMHITHNGQTKDVQLIVTSEQLDGFINLRNTSTKEKYELDNNSIILTQGIANKLEIEEGDTIQIEDEDGVQKEITVGKITEHYISHYMYMSDELYEQLYNSSVKDNVLLIKTNELSKEQEEALSKQLLENYKISSINLNSDVEEDFIDFDIIVIILILVSGTLALLVLYNLSNININERIRELATLKVLGFYPKEVDNYVNKEMTLLSLIGMIIGLGLGVILTMFILEIAQLELIIFPKTIEPLSYVFAFSIILAFTLLVNLFSHFTLKKIDMIESLKSVE